MRWFVAFAALSLVACKESVPEVVDADGDGHAEDVDCDDQNPLVNPGAVERCNGVDDDCDGETDEGLLTVFFADVDADGYGDPNNRTEACELPPGHVTNDGDCDDSDFDINPDAIEQCDATDRNCDGDPILGAVGGDFWWQDQDGDGFGDPAVEQRACQMPPGYAAAVVGQEDCDDADAEVFPGADERCNGVDDDCDGTVDDAPVDGDAYPLDRDGDGFGHPSDTAFVCAPGDMVDTDGDGTVDTVTVDNADDCDDTTILVRPGAEELCNGIDDDCDPSTPEDTFATDTVLWWRDADGDGAGLPTDAVQACEQPAGYAAAAAGEDCDDADPARSPSTFETCDGVDNDCDGAVDDNPVDATVWYLDSDGDGLGDPDFQTITACDQPSGRVSNGDDCDDLDAAVGAAATWWADTDGDGYGDSAVAQASCEPLAGYVLNSDDCDDTDPAITPDTVWYRDDDGDGYGQDAVTLTACEQPAGYAREPGDCRDDFAGINPGVPDGPPSDGIDDDCDGFVDEDAVVEHCGTIDVDEVWGNGLIHTVTCHVTVQGASQPTLIIQSGATVRFEDGVQLRVGVNQPGALDAQGITFEHADRDNPGQWGGILFGENTGSTVPSVLSNSTIRDATGYGVRIVGGHAELYGVDIRGTEGPGVELLAGATARIVDSTIADNVGSGIRGDATAALLAFSGNTLTGNTEKPLEIGIGSIALLDTTTVFTGNGEDVVLLFGGTLEQDVTWRGDLGVTYEVDGTIRVEGGSQPRFVVEDGVEARFAPDSGIEIGEGAPGSLEVRGTRIDHGSGDEYARYEHSVRFEARNGLPGGWNGVRFGPFALDSSIAGLDLRQAGANGVGGLVIEGDSTISPEDRAVIGVTTSRVAESSSSGLVGDAVSLQIEDARFVDNQDYGVVLGSDIVGATSWLRSSTSWGNAQSGVRVHPTLVELLDDGNTYGANALPLEITGGTVVDSAVWNALDEPYTISGPVSIENVDGPIVTLTEGVEIYFGEDGALLVGVADQGSLEVVGVAGQEVRMSALAEYTGATPVRGAWQGLVFGSFQRQSDLRHLEVAYAGKTTGQGAITFLAPSVNPIVLERVEVHDSGADGIQAPAVGSLGSQALIIMDSVIRDNDDRGVHLDAGGLYNQGIGVYSFTGNTVTGNGLSGLTVSATDVGRIGTDNNIGGNNLVTGESPYIGMYGGEIRQDMTMSKQVDLTNNVLPYRLMRDSLRVRDGAILTIEPGTVVEVEATLNKDLEIVVGRDDMAGGIHAVGTASEPILFTSASSTPFYGDWAGLSLGEECLTSVPGGCQLDYVIIEYAGSSAPMGSDRAALEVYIRDLTQLEPVLVTHTVVRHNLARGLMLYFDRGVVAYEPDEVPWTWRPYYLLGEDCLNGIDDDFDGQVDCNDAVCANSAYCGGFTDYEPYVWLICEDTNQDGVCSDNPLDPIQENHDYCFSGSAHGFTNYFCDNVDGNIFARNAENPYLSTVCWDDGPTDCSGQPSWAN